MDSLEPLGEWFAGEVRTRPKTRSEIREIEASLPFLIEFKRWELTERTFSLAMDIGMYLSQVFLAQHPSLRWKQPLGGKTYIHYGQPVLADFGLTELNAVQVVITIAYGIAGKTRDGGRLRNVYDVWSKMVGPRPTVKRPRNQ